MLDRVRIRPAAESILGGILLGGAFGLTLDTLVLGPVIGALVGVIHWLYTRARGRAFSNQGLLFGFAIGVLIGGAFGLVFDEFWRMFGVGGAVGGALWSIYSRQR